MLTRRAKAAFYRFAGPVMWLNGVAYRMLRAPRSGFVRVQLGPGQKNYLDGWINVDANMFTGKCDAWLDLRNDLPFRDATVDAFYSHHVVEHLPNLQRHFGDVFRCLKPGGAYRVAGPNGDVAIAKFVARDYAWFGDFPASRRSIGGRFENFVFCAQEHLTILTRSYLDELLTEAGFEEIREVKPVHETALPALFADCLEKEHESDYDAPHTLVLEALKPSPPATIPH